MEQVNVYCGGRCVGEVELRDVGGRTEIIGAAENPGDGLYRAVLIGWGGELPLGVMESANDRLILRRRPETAAVARLGLIDRVEMVCSFPFRKKTVWSETQTPGNLFRDVFLRQQLEKIRRALWRRAGGTTTLAMPLRDGEPFPLMALFCFARIERVEGERCAVFCFDEREEPVGQNGCQK